MTKRIRYFLRFLTALFQRRKKTILIGSTLGIIFFFLFLPTLTKFVLERQGVKSIGLVGRYTLENIPYEVKKQMSLGLTHPGKDGAPLPGLAKSWETSEEGKVYTFYLKDNLFWHDKTEIKANQINYNFQDVEVSFLDDKTIRFTLKEPFSPFPVVVSRPVFKKGLTGAGIYQVKKITKSGQFIETISLKSLDKKKPDLKYRFYPTEAAAKIGLKLGEVKTLENIADPSGLENFKNTMVVPQIRDDYYIAIFFNTNSPNLESKDFRQALAYAIPKDADRRRVLGPLSPLSWAYNPDLKSYQYDLNKAKELFERAFKDREGDKQVSLELMTVSSLLTEAEKVKESWEKLGIKITIRVLSSPGEEFQALLAIQEIPLDPDQYPLWHSSQEVSNITNFKNPRIDKLLEDGRKTSEQTERKKIYFDFQRFLVEDAPAVFLYHPTLYEISRK